MFIAQQMAVNLFAQLCLTSTNNTVSNNLQVKVECNSHSTTVMAGQMDHEYLVLSTLLISERNFATVKRFES